MLKKVSCLLLIIVCMTALFACNKSGEQTKNNKGEATEEKNLLSGKHKIKIDIIDYGVIEAELDADSAPITVTNFINLVKQRIDYIEHGHEPDSE